MSYIHIPIARRHDEYFSSCMSATSYELHLHVHVYIVSEFKIDFF